MLELTPLTLRSGVLARDAWSFTPGVVPLNHGSFGAVPRAVIARRAALLAEADGSAVGWFPYLSERVAEARDRVAPFLGVPANDMAFVPNASAGATVVLNSVRLAPDDEILVTDHGYGAVTMAVERAARRAEARVRVLHLPLAATSEEILQCFAEAITTNVRLVVVDQITSATARTLPTAQITRLAHEHGARVLVDGAHAPGLIANAARAGRGDWWFGNLHKWPSAPRGSAVLVTAAADRDELWPLIDSWGAGESFPARFDHQGTLDVTTHLTAPDAIDLIEDEYGWQRARIDLARIADAGAARVRDALSPARDIELPPADALTPTMRLVPLPGSLGATREEADGLRGRLYAATGIESAFTSFGGAGFLRLSVHLYTTPADISAFVDRAVPLLRDWSRG